jgi:type II secretory pathway pseudopilin PulG
MLAMLLALIAVMGILITQAMPSLMAETQRDLEAELIFRGEAMASAIKAYKAKTGAYPLSLEEIDKIRPRIIRKLYRDPMTADGEWDLVTAVQPGATGNKQGLPIVGVKSFCQKDSYRVYQNKTLISDWTFSAADNLLGIPGAGALSDLVNKTGSGAGQSSGGKDPGAGAEGPAAMSGASGGKPQ